MKGPCDRFRERLEAALRGRPLAQRRPELAWHEHLLGCSSCRDLLEAEQALEQLLASLPQPHLPNDLARRVLARLAQDRETALDQLLDLDSVESHEGLSERVLSGLREKRQRLESKELERLERLLDRLPAPSVPGGLAERVLAAVGRPAMASRGPVGLRRLSLWAAAAAALVLLIPMALRRGSGGDGPGEGGEGSHLAEADRELIEHLDVLERWDVLFDEDLDVLLASLDPISDQLLDLRVGSSAEEDR